MRLVTRGDLDGLTCAVLITSASLWQLALVRFYHGMATAAFIPVAMALVSDIFQKERGEKIGWFSTAALIGKFVAPLAGGGIIGAMVFNPGLSYKIVYLVCGMAGIIGLFLTMGMSVPEKKSKDKKSWNEIVTAFKSVISNKTIVITCAVEAAILFAY